MSDFKFQRNRSWIAIKPPLSFAFTLRPFNVWPDTVASSGTVSASSGDFTVQTLRAGMMASFPHSTPTLPSGTL